MNIGKYSLIKLKSGKEKLVLDSIELSGLLYILCEDTNSSNDDIKYDIYRVEELNIHEIDDQDELQEVYESFLLKLQMTN